MPFLPPFQSGEVFIKRPISRGVYSQTISIVNVSNRRDNLGFVSMKHRHPTSGHSAGDGYPIGRALGTAAAEFGRTQETSRADSRYVLDIKGFRLFSPNCFLYKGSTICFTHVAISYMLSMCRVQKGPGSGKVAAVQVAPQGLSRRNRRNHQTRKSDRAGILVRVQCPWTGTRSGEASPGCSCKSSLTRPKSTKDVF